jgi:UDP-GlcNAc:undecaprenyl-phosphate/decaprenyl-phosphate GlcNAc-1-phosphate transferase
MFLVAVCLPALLAAMSLSAMLTMAVRNVAKKYRWAKGPESDRHLHREPIPRLGGVAIYLTFVILLLVEVIGVSFGMHSHTPLSTRLVFRILAPATLMFLGGLADDIFGLPPIAKLLVQVVAGFYLYEIGCRVQFGGLQFHGVDYSAFASCAATVIWVAMLSNAFNLIDGLDGLAAGASVFPLLTFSAVALYYHNGQMTAASMILTGALLGFLRFNFNPASIFLGDCGSLFLGFMLSALSLAGSHHSRAPILLSVGLPVVACALPIAETCASVLRRFLSGRSVFSADREHFHHRLLNLGLTHRQVVIVLFSVSGMCSLMSVVMLFPRMNVLIIVGVALSSLVVVGIGKLEYPEFAELGRVLLRASEQKLVIARNVKIRRLVTDLKRCSCWEDVAESLQRGFQGGDFSHMELMIYSRQRRHSREPIMVYSRMMTLANHLSEMNWTMKLAFADEGHMGELELHCPYRKQSLMLDVNLLLQLLQPALSEAVRRIGTAEPEVFIPHMAAAGSASAD